MKYVLVTGAGSGLGYELTRKNLELGQVVFALDLNVGEKLQALENQAEGRLHIFCCDIGSTVTVEDTVKQIAEYTDRLDLIFNNAGIHRFKDWVTLEETDLDFCSTMFDINAVGPLRIVKAALPLLRKGAVIVNTSSEAGSLTNQKEIIGYGYAMSKAGMNMGARIMDNWLCGREIRTIMVHPGRMKTAMKGSHSNQEAWETAEFMMNIVEHIGELPEDMKFIDYQGRRFEW